MSARSNLYILGLLASACAIQSQASAQTSSPPRNDSASPTGVSYRDLTFSYDEVDLSIGGTGHEGLVLRRSYRSNPPNQPGIFWGGGWTDNFATEITVEEAPFHPDFEPPPANARIQITNVNIGMKSYGFIGGTMGGHPDYPSYVPWGPYNSVSKNGTELVFNGTTMSGYFTLTENDGTIINFSAGLSNAKVTDWTYPDGTRLTFTYSGSYAGGSRLIASNRGWGVLLIAPSTACVVNLAKTFVTASSTCPSGAPTVTYEYTSGTLSTSSVYLNTVRKAGTTTTYDYSVYDKLACVRDPGKSVCKIANTFGECPPIPSEPGYYPALRHQKDPIISQATATGESYTYTSNKTACRDITNGPIQYFPFEPNTTKMTKNGSETIIVDVNTGGLPSSITNPLDHVTSFRYEPGHANLATETVDILNFSLHEGNSTEFFRDDRGNVYQTVSQAKPGSGLSNIETSATYPAICSNVKTCNKPMSTTDAEGGTTSFTYDAAHGGVLTETLPAVGGINPVKRYAYAQQYAWLKASGSGYVQTATPVWLLTEERTCRTTATIGNACAGGATDEVVISYQYQAGNASAGSNLLLIGKAVAADGQTLRTCYGYDGNGNRIWETASKAGLATCA